MNLQERVAIVTGAAGGGCGRVIARRLAREGCCVIVSDIDDAKARETARQIEHAGGRSAWARCDVASEADFNALFKIAEQTFGGVDIVVNNAGPSHSPAALEGWFDTFEATFLGTARGTLLGVNALRRRGGGAIINIGSTSALGHGHKHSPWPAYDIAKAAVIRLTTTLGWLGEKENIRVNCLIPGWIASDEVAAYVASLSPAERLARGVPRTLITLDQVADVVLRLVTDESLAGRLVVYWNDQSPQLIADGDPGYAASEPL